VLLALGKPLLWLFGPQFTVGYDIMFVAAIGLVVRSAIGPVERLLNMLGHQRVCAFAYLGAFGVNLASAPILPDRQGASLGGKIAPQAFAPLLAGSFSRLLELWRQSEPAALAQAWLSRAHPVGSPLTVHSTAEERVTGRFDGIEPDGALRLRRDDGMIDIVRAGDVEL